MAQSKAGDTNQQAQTAVDNAAAPPAQPGYNIDVFYAWCKGCGLCEAYCPKDVYTCRADGKPDIVQPELCNGCQLCVLQCPDFAIRVVPHDHIEENG